MSAGDLGTQLGEALNHLVTRQVARVERGVVQLQKPLEKGAPIRHNLLFERVMLVSQGEDVRVGQPVIEGALVRGTVVAPIRGKKVIVFKKKRRKGYKRTQGHRQNYYRIRVEAIEA